MTNIRTIVAQAQRVTEDAIKNIQTQIATLEEEKAKRTAELDEAIEILMGHLRGLGVDNGQAARPTQRGGKAARRTAAEMKKEAEGMIAFIKAGGSEGVTGGELKARFGPYQSYKDFIKAKTKVTVKTRGQRSGMRYFLD